MELVEERARGGELGGTERPGLRALEELAHAGDEVARAHGQAVARFEDWTAARIRRSRSDGLETSMLTRVSRRR